MASGASTGRRREGRWEMNAEAFDALLALLDPDREKAGYLFERLRQKLLLFFDARRCSRSEDLADITLDRLARRAAEGTVQPGRVTAFCYGIAKHVIQEEARIERHEVGLESWMMVVAEASDASGDEVRLACLDKCLDALPEKLRTMTLEFYRLSGRRVEENRKNFAKRLGLSHSALVLRVFRVRHKLESCVWRCLEGLNG
jgi:hypothetical protein